MSLHQVFSTELPKGTSGVKGVGQKVARDAGSLFYGFAMVLVVGTAVAVAWQAARKNYFPNAPGPGSIVTDRFGTPVA